MRLFLDENMPVVTPAFLRELGHDAVGVHDEGLVGEDDDCIFRHAKKTGRTLLTYNADFVDLRALGAGGRFDPLMWLGYG